jgi:hypothetical protein
MREVPYLRVVPDATERCGQVEERVDRGTAQLSLFPLGSPKTIAVVVMEVMSGGRFAALVANLRPTLVVDVRPYPRFDVPGYDRAAAFLDFRRVHAQYLHVARVDAATPEHLVRLETGSVYSQTTDRRPSGPILVLCDGPSTAEPLLARLSNARHPTSGDGWSIRIES